METLVTPSAHLVNKAFEFGMIQMQEEITSLVDLVRTLRPKNVMEIGSESGGTFYLWCRLASLGGLKISLDLPTGKSGSCKFADKDALAERTNRFLSWSANVKVVTGDSHDPDVQTQIAKILGNEKLDFLFIDGDHTYEGVKLDFEMYKSFVRFGGLIAFHDIRDSEYHRTRGCNVAQFWQELPQPKLEIIDPLAYWGGIGCITA